VVDHEAFYRANIKRWFTGFCVHAGPWVSSASAMAWVRRWMREEVCLIAMQGDVWQAHCLLTPLVYTVRRNAASPCSPWISYWHMHINRITPIWVWVGTKTPAAKILKGNGMGFPSCTDTIPPHKHHHHCEPFAPPTVLIKWIAPQFNAWAAIQKGWPRAITLGLIWIIKITMKSI
jgi:hypothetical protein